MSLNPWDLDKHSSSIVDLYVQAEQKIIDMIISSTAKNAHNNDISLNYNNVSNYANGLVKYSKQLKNDVHGAVNSANDENIKPVDSWLTKHNGGLHKSTDKPIVSSKLKETDDYMSLISRNMTKNSADSARKVIMSASNEFQLGKITKEQAVTKSLHDWIDNSNGIPALIDKAGKQWSPETYVRTVLNTQSNRTANEVELQRLKDNGSIVEISSHAGARPLCAPYQGKRYSMLDNDPKYPSFYSTSYGRAAGILGINCKHHLLPVANDGSVFSSASISDAENERVYQNTQIQRQYEREIRKAKNHVYVSKQMLEKPEEVQRYQAKVDRLSSKLNSFLNDTGLKHQSARERMFIDSKKRYNTGKGITDSQRVVRTKLYNKEWGLKVNPDKQVPHMESTHAKGKSYFFDGVDPQKLLDKYSGTGELNRIRNGSLGNKEIIETVKSIGIDGKTGEKTNHFVIHHSAKRTHLVPVKNGRRE